MMVGAPGARWHLELVAGETVPSPTEEDLLVLYLDGPVDDARLVAAGGRRVAQGEYWDRWGVTVATRRVSAGAEHAGLEQLHA